MTTTSTDSDRTSVRLAPAWARGIGLVLAHGVWRTTITDAERVPATGPVVIAANHVSVIDGPLLAGASCRRLNILVKEEMFDSPVGWLLRGAGQIPVNRSGGGRSALTTGLDVLNRGGAVGIFPEGNRGQGDVSSVRAGVAWLAVHGDAPVIPVAVLGTRYTGEGVNHIPGFRRHLYVRFGEPLRAEQSAGLSRRELVSQTTIAVQDALAALVAETAQLTGKKLPED